MDNTHRKIIELIVLYMENKISKTQQEELTAWLEEDEKNRSFFQQVISPEKSVQKFETRKHIDSERAFSKFKKKILQKRSKQKYWIAFWYPLLNCIKPWKNIVIGLHLNI